VKEIIQKMDNYGEQGIPFFFFVDFEMQQPLLYPLDSIPKNIHYHFKDFSSTNKINAKKELFPDIQAEEIPFSTYKKAFDKVYYHLNRGDSYLLNLTLKTPISLSNSLEEMYLHSNAPYKILIENKLLCFSPEAFIHIKNGKISSFPMKGTIDANIPNAKNKLLNDYKESCEHNTIVDLIRNDLSMVAKKVRVERFKYIEEIKSKKSSLLQMSSMISGELNCQTKLGTIIHRMLPAGSISGAPKKRTIEIIQDAEGEKRAYYTGVFGIFNGKEMQSAVAIRFIEKLNEKYFYRSGGGITSLSECEKEYQEILDKIYVPTT
jgi:para-aminobenzoate synthetase component I